jgi:predicted nuclease of predicted toxin-antitoxin system
VAAVKLDENVPDSMGAILRGAGHDVVLARDEQLAGVPDDQLLKVAVGEGRVLISFDRGFANVIQHPPGATSGVVVIR